MHKYRYYTGYVTALPCRNMYPLLAIYIMYKMYSVYYTDNY